VTKNVEFATFTQTVMITTVLLNTGSSPAGSGITILYLLTGPMITARSRALSTTGTVVDSTIGRNIFIFIHHIWQKEINKHTYTNKSTRHIENKHQSINVAGIHLNGKIIK